MKRATLYTSLLLAVSAAAWSQNNIPGNAISASKHYRESGVGNSTGRSGGATMTARALLGKDNNTTVEVTTGTLDSSTTPPGSFAKVQFKPLTSLGNALFADNFTGLNTAIGYYSFTWPSFHRAQQVQLQGNITGIDQNRTDVVTVVETVKLRPDLAVQNLNFPSSALVNTPVNIGANIVEMNGDTGATTTCVLAIDGTNVDQMAGVYVDAAGSVSCAFTHTFTTTGSHTIAVTAANVVPTDWDTSNNSASGTITINNPDNLPHGYAYFSGSKGQFPIQASYSYEQWYLGNVIENSSNNYGNAGAAENSYEVFYNSACGKLGAIQFPVNFSESETMDGVQVYSFVDAGITGYSWSSAVNGSICNTPVASVAQQYGSDYANDHWQHIYFVQYFDGLGNTIYSFQQTWSQRWAGDVTYYSYGYSCYWWIQPGGNCNNPATYYTWNYSGQAVYGTMIPMGSTWVPSISVKDAAGNTYSGTITVPLTTSQQNYSWPNTCSNYGPDAYGYSYQYCSSGNYNYTLDGGSASK